MRLNTTNEVHVALYLSDTFPIKNSIKEGDALSPLLLTLHRTRH
jgi:hypothetical protein